jgi:hypothetical protein
MASGFTLDGHVLKPNGDLSWRDINGELVALNVKSGEYFVFNEIGRIVWLAIAEGRNTDGTVKQILDEYDAKEHDGVVSDVRKFVDGLLERKLVDRCAVQEEGGSHGES